MWRRARVASWRQLSWLLPTVARDLRVVVGEDVVQQEDRALDRVQLFEQHEERERERVRLLGVRGRIDRDVLVRQERLREPLADVHLAPCACRSQLVDAQPRDDRRQVCPG